MMKRLKTNIPDYSGSVKTKPSSTKVKGYQ